MRIHKNIIIVLMAFLAIGMSAYSPSAKALKDDRTKPIKITADTAERDEKLGITLYHGNVVIRQGSILIEAETVTIKTHISPISSHEELEEIITIGKPSHLQQRLESNNEIVDAVSTTMRYEVSSDAITLIESAVLKQEGRIVTGDRITYDIGAQKIIASGEKTTEKSPDRVTVTLPPKTNPPK